MRYSLKWTALAAAAAIQSCAAQTYTDCNPTETTCPADDGLSSYTFTTDFTTGADSFDGWNVTSGSISSSSLGAAFTINEQGDAPTIETDFYIFFGYVEVVMRAANGTGVISTAILESDDLDEIDWEQISTFDNQITTNYFGKGNTTSYDRATTVSVSDPLEEFHTYGISWTSEKTEWFVDGTSVRTLNYADAVDGTNYPQTPMRVRIGIWAGGDPDNSEGTIEWAGGETDYTQGPFTMYVSSVSITNYNPASQYTWSDQTGSFESITASNDTTTDTDSDSSSDDSSSTTIVSSSSSSATSTASGSSSVSSATSSLSVTLSPTTPVVVHTSNIASSTSASTSSTPSSSTTVIPTSSATMSIMSSMSMTPSSTIPATSSPTLFFNASSGVLPSFAMVVLASLVAGLLQF